MKNAENNYIFTKCTCMFTCDIAHTMHVCQPWQLCVMAHTQLCQPWQHDWIGQSSTESTRTNQPRINQNINYYQDNAQNPTPCKAMANTSPLLQPLFQPFLDQSWQSLHHWKGKEMFITILMFLIILVLFILGTDFGNSWPELE